MPGINEVSQPLATARRPNVEIYGIDSTDPWPERAKARATIEFERRKASDNTPEGKGRAPRREPAEVFLTDDAVTTWAAGDAAVFLDLHDKLNDHLRSVAD